MPGFDLKRSLMNQNRQNVVTNMFGGVSTKTMSIPYEQLEMGEYKIYDIDSMEVQDLAESIAAIGLEQNLVVKETDDPNKYVVVTGHKRMTAIQYIFDNNIEVNDKVRKTIESPMCVVVPKNEDELVTKFRMHETNVHQRKGFTVAEIEDYMRTVEEAKKRNLEINGRKIVGTTRAILKARFDISEPTAKKYIKLVKEGNDELKKAVDNGEISINNAYDVLMGHSEPTVQNVEPEAVEEIKEKVKPDKQEYSIEELKKDLKKIEKSIAKLDDKLDNSDLDIKAAASVSDNICSMKMILEEVKKTIN